MAAAHHSQHYNLSDNNNITGATAAVAYNTSTATAQQKSPSTQHIFNAPQQRGINISTIQPSSTVTSSSQNNLESTVNNAFNTQPPVNLQNTVLLGLQPPPNQAGLMGNVSQMTHHSDGQQFVQHQNISGSAFSSHHILQDNLQKSQQFGQNANTLQSQSVTAQPEFLSHQTVGGVTDHPLPMEISQNEQGKVKMVKILKVVPEILTYLETDKGGMFQGSQPTSLCHCCKIQNVLFDHMICRVSAFLTPLMNELLAQI